MSKSDSLLAPFRGKMGNIVAARWKGVQYLRQYVIPANPRTEAQIEHRARFKFATQFYAPMSSFIEYGWHASVQKQTGYNAASSYLYKNAVQGTNPNYTVDYSKALVTRGPLPLALAMSAKVSATVGLSLSWTDNSTYDDGAHASDVLMLLIYNEDKAGAIGLTSTTAVRSDGTFAYTTPTEWAGDTIHVYAAFHTADSTEGSDTRLSNSTYLGSFTAV